MIERLCIVTIVIGVLLRVLSFAQHDEPRGDVLLDVGVTRHLAHGEGYLSGYERGTAVVLGDDPLPPLDRADQHPPLWAFIGARLAWPAGSAFSGLKLASLILGLLLLALVWHEATQIVRHVGTAPAYLPALGTALVAMSFPMIDFSGNGALYMGQAVAVVLLVRLLGRRRPSPLIVGMLLGATCLLNYQALVLLPVPLLVLPLTAERSQRLRALEAGLLAVAVALLMQLPWAFRNDELFGSPLYSANLFYPLYRAGIVPLMGVEQGIPFARFTETSALAWMVVGVRAWMPHNALYLFTTGLVLWPGLIALAAAGLVPLSVRALREQDRRVVAGVLTLLALVAVGVIWPGMKLRYLVPMTPLVVLLGLRVLATSPTRGERRAAWAVGLAWLALTLLTLDDVLGTAEAARPERWAVLAGGGLVLVVVPLLLRHTRLAGDEARSWLCSGLLVLPVVTGLALLPAPHTAYHSSLLTPDFFGHHKEQAEERLIATLDEARAQALADGCTRLAGPMQLLAWPRPGLVQMPLGAGSPAGDEALAAIVDAGRADHVLVLSGEGWPEGLGVGDTWLDGRLVVTGTWPAAGQEGYAAATLSRVRDPR
ncbi:MAG: hypothetical protein ACYTG2_15260 [Planctomycetota bacterium]|jgi:hypothetical protein